MSDERLKDDIAGKREFVDEYGAYLSAPQGRSMHPFIRGGRDLVAMVKPDGRPGKYDVILYENAYGNSVIHRILRVCEDKGVFVVRGDNCYYKEYVPFDGVIAVADHYLLSGKKEVRDRGMRMFLIRLWTLIYPLRFLLNLGKRVFLHLFKKKKGV